MELDPILFYLVLPLVTCLVLIAFGDGMFMQNLRLISFTRLQVAPFEIIRCEKYEGSTAPTMPSAENTEQMNQNMVDHDTSFLNEKGKVQWLSCMNNGQSL